MVIVLSCSTVILKPDPQLLELCSNKLDYSRFSLKFGLKLRLVHCSKSAEDR